MKIPFWVWDYERYGARFFSLPNFGIVDGFIQYHPMLRLELAVRLAIEGRPTTNPGMYSLPLLADTTGTTSPW
jgi:hypothetical protein